MGRHVTAELLALAERRLPAGEHARVEAHIAGCPACRARAAEVLRLVDELQALPVALGRAPQGRRLTASWPEVWARVWGQAPRWSSQRLGFSLSIVTTILAFFLKLPLIPAAGATPPAAALVHTPQPYGVVGTSLASHAQSTAAAAHGLEQTATVARPMPIPTPVPAPHG